MKNPGLSGLTLRDLFAALAMNRILEEPVNFADEADHGKSTAQVTAEQAYAFANAMLTEREKQQ